MMKNKRYHIWTIGCQMNVADSGRVAAEMDALGYAPTDDAAQADVIVLNTCVVRQSAEDRAAGHLWSLKPLKEADPGRVIALMGCLVGVKPNPALAERFPFVDVFMPPSDPGPLLGYLAGRSVEAEARALEEAATRARYALQDGASGMDGGGPEAAAAGLSEPGDGQLRTDEEPGGGRRLQSVRHLALNGEAPVAANV